MKKIYIPKYFRQNEFDKDCSVTIIPTQFDQYIEHGHDFYEMEYITEGSMNTVINGKRHSVKKGDLVFLTPLDVHSYEKNPDHSVIKSIVLHFDPSMTVEIPELSGSRANILTEGSVFEYYLRQLLAESFQHDQYRREIINDLTKVILMKYFRILRLKYHKEGFYERPDDISAVIGYVYKNFREPIRLEQLSRFVGYSVPYLSRKFYSATGEHLTDFINNVRLEYAANLIRCRDISITNICFESGFGSMRNFRECFRRKEGCSPSDYRKKFWNETPKQQ